MNDDPTAPLYDIYFPRGMQSLYPISTSRLEEPLLGCPCQGTHRLGCEWLYQRAPKCTCSRETDDFTRVMHELTCDTVPCPFCPLEGK